MTGILCLYVETYEVFVKSKGGSSFMMTRITAFLTGLSPRQRLLALAAVAALTLAAVSLLIDSNVPETVAPAAEVNSRPSPVRPVMPQGYGPEAVIRDPFAVLAAQQKPVAQPDKIADRLPAASGRVTASGASRPVLTGVVTGEYSQLAIIEYDKESRSYQVLDEIGPYQVLDITPAAVVLNGPGGRITLKLGR